MHIGRKCKQPTPSPKNQKQNKNSFRRNDELDINVFVCYNYDKYNNYHLFISIIIIIIFANMMIYIDFKMQS